MTSVLRILNKHAAAAEPNKQNKTDYKLNKGRVWCNSHLCATDSRGVIVFGGLSVTVPARHPIFM